MLPDPEPLLPTTTSRGFNDPDDDHSVISSEPNLEISMSLPLFVEEVVCEVSRELDQWRDGDQFKSIDQEHCQGETKVTCKTPVRALPALLAAFPQPNFFA